MVDGEEGVWREEVIDLSVGIEKGQKQLEEVNVLLLKHVTGMSFSENSGRINLPLLECRSVNDSMNI